MVQTIHDCPQVQYGPNGPKRSKTAQSVPTFPYGFVNLKFQKSTFFGTPCISNTDSHCVTILYFWSCLGGSCICGLSQILYLWIVTWICWRSRFVGEAEWCLCLPLLRSVRLSRRLSVCHTRPRPNSQVGEHGVQKCRQCGQNVKNVQNVQNVDKICPKSSRARGSSPMVWLTARRPGAIHGMGWVSDLPQDHLWKKLNWPNYSESATKPAVNYHEEESGASEVLPYLTNIEEPSLSDTYLYFAVKLIVYVVRPTSHWSFELYETEIFICIRKSNVSSVLLAQCSGQVIWNLNLLKLSWNIDLSSKRSLHLIVIRQKIYACRLEKCTRST